MAAFPVEARTKTRLSDLWSRLVNYGGAAVQVVLLSLLLQLRALIMPFSLQLTMQESSPGRRQSAAPASAIPMRSSSTKEQPVPTKRMKLRSAI